MVTIVMDKREGMNIHRQVRVIIIVVMGQHLHVTLLAVVLQLVMIMVALQLEIPMEHMMLTHPREIKATAAVLLLGKATIRQPQEIATVQHLETVTANSPAPETVMVVQVVADMNLGSLQGTVLAVVADMVSQTPLVHHTVIVTHLEAGGQWNMMMPLTTRDQDQMPRPRTDDDKPNFIIMNKN